MKGNPGRKIVLVLFIMFCVLFPNVSQAQVKKVRVIVKKSSIRSEPNMQSMVIGSPPLGTVFEVIEKGDIWYKIKLNKELYGLTEGYLNMMFVEEIQEIEVPVKEEEEKKTVDTKEKEEKTEEAGVKVEKEPIMTEVPLADQEAEEEKIRAVVREYTKALQDNKLVLFYEQNCVSEFYSKVREDADWITRTYDRVNSCVSDISITFDNGRGADVSLSLIITGLPRVGGIRKLLFEGTYNWSLIKQDSAWKITGVTSQPYK
jgi:hypothetical protein